MRRLVRERVELVRRTEDMARHRSIAVLTAGLALVIAPAAAAKGDVVARVEHPVALRAPVGTTVTITWTLRAHGRPFGASGLYLRLRGERGATTIAPARSLALGSGRYRARIRIPRGGVRAAAVGLAGWRTTEGGTSRADAFFPILNAPAPRHART